MARTESELVDEAIYTVSLYARKAVELQLRLEATEDKLRVRDRMFKVKSDIVDILYKALMRIGGPEADVAIKKAKLRQGNEGPL